ncbi:MAG: hypothetical protein OXC57_14370 [Rhodobacteraceae bacterium]|nr:hypothetical protein [Paracoccaceae bacterium]
MDAGLQQGRLIIRGMARTRMGIRMPNAQLPKIHHADMSINRTDRIVGGHILVQARGKQVHHTAGLDLLAASIRHFATFI